MTPAITLEELLAWNDETAQKWLAHLAANPALLDVPSGIFGTKDVRALVHHIFAVEYRYSERLRGLPASAPDQLPGSTLEELARLHNEAMKQYRGVLADANFNWNATIELKTLSAGTLHASLRKMIAHALLHGIRHWAQLGTLARTAGYPNEFSADLLMSPSVI